MHILKCDLKCVVDYHNQCWKSYKDSEGRKDDKDFLAAGCPTPGKYIPQLTPYPNLNSIPRFIVIFTIQRLLDCLFLASRKFRKALRTMREKGP